jgi:hypothetical protein
VVDQRDVGPEPPVEAFGAVGGSSGVGFDTCRRINAVSTRRFELKVVRNCALN